MMQVVVYLLAAACGLAAMLGLILVIYYVKAMRRFAGRLDTVASELEVYLETRKEQLRNEAAARGEFDNVPPMRINLETYRGSTEWLTPAGKQCAGWLANAKFQLVGDFTIEELSNEVLRTFLSEDGKLIAALRRPPQTAQPYLEFCFKIADGEAGGVSNPPLATLPLSDDAVGRFFEGHLSEQPDLPERMLAAARQLAEQQDVVTFTEAEVPVFYEQAHASEMDERLSQGGVSEGEIRRSLLAQGVEPSEEEIESIQTQWQVAIEKHLLDFSSRGLNQFYSGQQVMIVYDGSVERYLIHRLRELLSDLAHHGLATQSEVEESVGELRTLLADFSPREAVARLRPHLPQDVRYRLVDQLTHPLEADLYVLPSPQ